ncbi:MAG: lysylphosphatidylglycerol synthase domain-containing protein [Candidatus Latescibacterota bacterium]|nr:lysylphosphatidylglycerol synthase domain-containing protein [Candidatus Latescibacterota bacterium]
MVSVGILVLISYHLKYENLLIAARQLDLWLLVFTAGLTVVGIFLQSLKWKLFLAHCQPVCSLWKSMESVLLGMALGLFTPGRLGEIGRGFAFGSNRAITVMFAGFDRLISVFCGLIFSIFCVCKSDLLKVDLILIGSIFFILILILFLFSRGFLVKRYSIVSRFINQSGLITSKEYFFIFLYSLVFNVVFYFQFFLLVGEHYKWDLNIFTLIPIIYTVKSFLPISVGDLGIREGVAILLFSQCGLDPEPAFNASLGIFTLNVLIPAICGWLWCGGRTITLQLAEVKKGIK